MAQPSAKVGRRERTRTRVEPFARVLGRIGLTPNALTLIGFGIALGAAVAAAAQLWLAAGLLVVFGAFFDLFDGALARATNTSSRFGAFMDSTFDRAGEAVVYVGIAVGGVAAGLTQAAVLGAAAMAAAFMVSYTRAKSESMGFSSGRGMAAVGIAPREVRIVILVAGLLLAGSGPINVSPAPNEVCVELCVQPPGLMLLSSLGLITLLATITTIQRIVFVYRQSKSQEVND